MTSGIAQGDRRIVAPYVTPWTEEVAPDDSPLVELRGGGIGYADETLADRDRHGVLWSRTPHRPGVGRPEFIGVHALRQRRTMSRLLCQVCAGPADRTEEGLLFLLKDHRDDWLDWPDRMGVTEPPVCRPCAALSVRICPALRKGAVLVRAPRYEVVGVRGALHAGGVPPRQVGQSMVVFASPTSRWVLATALVRELFGCRLIELDEMDGMSACRT